MEYADEPRLVFSPLSEAHYSQFYSLEMDTFTDDLPFYSSLLNKDDHVLELGCGSGRLTRLVAGNCKSVTGVDISMEMINRAKIQPDKNISYRLGDMLDIDFPTPFTTIIIPYNTMNLLGSRIKVEQCLQRCRVNIKDNGILAMQLYHPDKKILENDKEKIFQFVTLKDGQGGIVIKETLKNYQRDDQLLILEERYRVRPVNNKDTNRDLKHVLKLYAPKLETWEFLLANNGFRILEIYGNYELSPFSSDSDTILFIKAAPV